MLHLFTHQLWLLIVLPVLAGGLSVCLPTARLVLAAGAGGVLVAACADVAVVVWTLQNGPLTSGGGWFRLDALSACHLAVLAIVFLISSLYAPTYFRNEPEPLQLNTSLARRFVLLWHGALAAMTAVLISNNLGLMWVGVEATTLLTSLLICLHVNNISLEATWKYLIVCSVGVAFAFMGVLLLAASAGVGSQAASALHWTHLRMAAAALDPRLVKLSFLFLLVGYGTKAGIAPMHSWLPDAHSQAPAPVSAFFSGFMLNMALYCIMRHLPIVRIAVQFPGWADNLLVGFGLFSMLIAAVFILSQHDLKRLLAYHSVEHMGIIMLGLGLGPLGVFAALFHTLNHALCKTLAFFSAGRIGQMYDSHDMRQITGVMAVNPFWGTTLVGSMLALIGVAPFAVFMSELVILKAAVDAHRYATLILFLLGTSAVFIGALRHLIDMAWGNKPSSSAPGHDSMAVKGAVVAALAILLLLGIWLPPFLREVFRLAAGIVIGDGP